MAGVRNHDTTIGSFGNNAELITKSDATVFDGPLTIICYDGTTVKIMTAAGQILIHPVIAGLPLPVKVLRVYATNTDATKIVGYW